MRLWCVYSILYFFFFPLQFKRLWDFVMSIAVSNFSYILWDFVVLIIFLIFHLCCEILHQHIVNACVQLCKIYINSKRKLIIVIRRNDKHLWGCLPPPKRRLKILNNLSTLQSNITFPSSILQEIFNSKIDWSWIQRCQLIKGRKSMQPMSSVSRSKKDDLSGSV